MPAEYGRWTLNDNVNGILTVAPTSERYATSDVANGQNFRIRRYNSQMSDSSKLLIKFQIWPEFCLISAMKSTVALGQTTKNMKFTYNINPTNILKPWNGVRRPKTATI